MNTIVEFIIRVFGSIWAAAGLAAVILFVGWRLRRAGRRVDTILQEERDRPVDPDDDLVDPVAEPGEGRP